MDITLDIALLVDLQHCALHEIGYTASEVLRDGIFTGAGQLAGISGLFECDVDGH